ncbi:porin family protein [Mesorhizobium sp. M2D.F.Ca.ET.185.01.1.1]|uniref:outer membrane protein n=1 Tax=unclassified Mesorhizobium TaxID=325217 RepID=UPI000FCA1D6B|nr:MULTISPECIES: outer membrane protein [unclassified Mesorhizobium]TGP57183.1 porin family protein [bacterium M00.F.Ca.ET.230.01.1.1]TGP76974.1 porin family protein [bacterium M00.F.Ca.ET.227.01.1.1]TGP84897.1 porin family protein [bacterium M00.F.Ca.ET.221.01.1.1]TGP88467.1 porin family protein [bacterium M00.F.Ca.ET.222.01.1.1]TGT68632.1 porin family protein [bacterium M00.F.Ca.ET.159.01.1.1]TGT80466.1 porin family protein [bacterium M00.F.Ca.ET.157.01.1.1]TGU04731.1 porin family protein 
MKTNLKFAPLAAALGLFAFAGTAFAADVVSEEPPAPAPVAELPVASWAGPYAGINLGYGFGGHVKAPGVDAKTKGFIGGVFGGYNWQQENFVYGAEADLGYNGTKGSDNGLSAKSGIEGSLRARLGYAVTPEILLYGTGGLAAKNQKIDDSVTGVNDSKGMLGWTAGAGTDIKITDNVFGRVEYRYTDYGSKTFGDTGKVKSSDNRVTFGVGMKF